MHNSARSRQHTAWNVPRKPERKLSNYAGVCSMTFATVFMAAKRHRNLAALIVAWWGVSLAYVISASVIMDVGVYDLTVRTCGWIPVQSQPANGLRPWGRRSEPPDGLGREFSSAFPMWIRSAPGSPPWRGDYLGELIVGTLANSVGPPIRLFPGVLPIQTLLLPYHGLICASTLLLFSRGGVPLVKLDGRERRDTYWRVFWSSMWRGMLLIPLAFIAQDFWFVASETLRIRGYTTPPFVPGFAMIDDSAGSLAVPLWGALLGHVGIVVVVARRKLWSQIKTRRYYEWVSVCLRCGYPAAHDHACPECGEAFPRSLGAVYLGRWHARLSRNKLIDIPVVLYAMLIVMLFAWPLISGFSQCLI